MIIELLTAMLTMNPSQGASVADSANAAMKVHCGACHDPEPVASNPAALKIFDLSEDHWPGRLSERRLKMIVSRFEGRSKMSTRELTYVVPRGIAPPPKPTESEIKVLRDYIEQELLSRAKSKGEREEILF